MTKGRCVWCEVALYPGRGPFCSTKCMERWVERHRDVVERVGRAG